MAAQFGIVLPLWSYAADRGALLERAAGEIGLEHVTVPVVTGPQTHFRVGTAPEQPHFETAGGWHFPHAAKAYAAVGIRPVRASWFAGADVLGRLREHAQRQNLKLVMRLDLRGAAVLLEQASHLLQRNAWGQEVTAAGGCASQPDLRELVRATLDDLHRYEPAAWELADWVPDLPMDRALPRPLRWQPAARRLVDTCFCSACRQVAARAGVAPDQAARSVRVQVERALAGTPALTEDDPLVADYLAVRVADCGDWLARLAQTDPLLQVVFPADEPFPYRDRVGVRPLLRVVRRTQRAEEGLAPVQADDGLSLAVWQPLFDEPADLVRTVAEGVRHGVRWFDFEQADEAPRDALTALKQAVRFARRGQP